MNQKHFIKYVIMFSVVCSSTYFIPNCSIMNEHAIYIGLLAATTFATLDRYIPNVVIVEKKELY